MPASKKKGWKRPTEVSGRWTINRKEEFLNKIANGEISEEEALRENRMSLEELRAMQSAYPAGKSALKATCRTKRKHAL